MPVQIKRIAYFDWSFAVSPDGSAFLAISYFIVENGKTN
jgi:hypothetical protein